jgi:hypothetical protein
MTNQGSHFCWTCGEVFAMTAFLDAHQLQTGHEMDQADPPLHQADPHAA